MVERNAARLGGYNVSTCIPTLMRGTKAREDSKKEIIIPKEEETKDRNSKEEKKKRKRETRETHDDGKGSLGFAKTRRVNTGRVCVMCKKVRWCYLDRPGNRVTGFRVDPAGPVRVFKHWL
ncbi:uncharacterized protein G2W53_015410 [Senna tora]|uniref:Uncharacterized protein n=1 Tax=Senna tora TaxID=362788 RepID=A0A834WVG2_9FABA|nr:uncharacterized protein G2W53_015410 [Senna tora]